MSKLTDDDLIHHFKLMRTDPQRYLELANEVIGQNPSDPGPYFSRHQLWQRLGRFDLALQDLDTSISLGGIS